MPVPDEREELAPYPAHLRPVRFPSATADTARATCQMAFDKAFAA